MQRYKKFFLKNKMFCVYVGEYLLNKTTPTNL